MTFPFTRYYKKDASLDAVCCGGVYRSVASIQRSNGKWSDQHACYDEETALIAWLIYDACPVLYYGVNYNDKEWIKYGWDNTISVKGSKTLTYTYYMVPRVGFDYDKLVINFHPAGE
jgi:hypothetical protein